MTIPARRTLLAAAVVIAAELFAPCVVHAQDATIHAGAYLDVQRGRLRAAALISIEDGRITGIEPAKNTDIPAEAIDLSGYTLLPGLIDVHTHLCDNTHLGEEWDPWTLGAPAFGIIGVANAKKVLLAGFTTVRNVSEPFFAGVALRDAVAEGLVPGPRIYATGPMISMTGGHGDWGNWMGPQHDDTTPAEKIADGVDEVRKAARTHLKHGADWLKVAATGGFASHGTIPGAASYTVEEIEAAVQEAANRGLYVAAHAHGAAGINNAVAAGVRSIEHAALLNQDSIELMKEHGVFLVADLLAAHYDLVATDKDWSEKGYADGQTEYDSYAARVVNAHSAGVKLAFGTDAGASPHGRGAEQFGLMVAAGIAPADAIRSATLVAAELLGIENDAGSIEIGKWADLIAVKGDPLTDVTVLTDVEFVMKAGVIYKASTRSPGHGQSAE